MSNVKRTLLGAGVLLVSLSMLSACQTVKGTVQGAEKDMHAAGAAMEGHHVVAKKKVVKKTHKHHHMVKKSETAADSEKAADKEPAKPADTNNADTAS